MGRLNILISAHEFSPDQGSECAVGWNIVKWLSLHHNLTVLYAKTNQFESSNYELSVNNFFKKNENANNLKLISVSQPKVTKLIARINAFMSPSKSAIGFAPLYYIGYNFWQKKVYKIVLLMLKSEKFDVVHHLTSISFREPGYLWNLNIPFVWGPCSGLVKMPSAFYPYLKKKEILFELIRRFSNSIQSSLSVRIKKAIKKASVIYPVTGDDFIFFKACSNNEVKQMLDVGTYLHKDSVFSEGLNSGINQIKKFQIIWVGRLVYSKALDLLLYSLSSMRELNDKFDVVIIGDGPLRSQYTSLAEKLEIKNLKWLGNIDQMEVFEVMNHSDLLVHTSIKEATSAVILEALSFGLPVICHDAFGMAIAIDETCGIKIPLVSPEKSIYGFGEAIKKLVFNHDLHKKLKDGAYKRAIETSWESMAKRISDDYLNIHLSKNL